MGNASLSAKQEINCFSKNWVFHPNEIRKTRKVLLKKFYKRIPVLRNYPHIYFNSLIINLIMERLTSLDICRGIAIICMVASDIPVVTKVGVIKLFGNIFAAPFFLFIAGVSYELFVFSRLERDKNAISLNIETFWKAIILLAITQIIFFAGVLLFPSSFSMGFNSSIFLVIAVGYLLSIFIPRKWVYIIPIIIAPFLISYYLNNSISGMLWFLFSESFPIIPFISYFFAGRVIMIFYEKTNDFHMKNGKIVLFSALFVAIMAIIFQFMLPFTGKTRTEILGFLLLVGIMICILSLISVCNNRIKGFDFFLSPFERIGRIAFSVYYAFYALGLIVFPYLNSVFIINFDPKIQIITYYLSIISILIIAASIEKIWRKVGYKFGLEWALRYGSANLTKLTIKAFSLKG